MVNRFLVAKKRPKSITHGTLRLRNELELGTKSAMGPEESKKGKLTTIHHLEIG